jgi:hypothetical protein
MTRVLKPVYNMGFTNQFNTIQNISYALAMMH